MLQERDCAHLIEHYGQKGLHQQCHYPYHQATVYACPLQERGGIIECDESEPEHERYELHDGGLDDDCDEESNVVCRPGGKIRRELAIMRMWPTTPTRTEYHPEHELFLQRSPRRTCGRVSPTEKPRLCLE